MPRGFLGGSGGGARFGGGIRGEAGGGLTDPGGILYPGIDPESRAGAGGEYLNDYLNTVSQMIGAPYRFWGNGGDGKTNQTISDVLANGESCSGMFVFAFVALGLTPPFSGTYDAQPLLTETFDPNKTYEIGTFLVNTNPPEGHMALVTGSGNKVTQALLNYGITDQFTIADTMAMGGTDLQFTNTGSFADLGTSNTAGTAASAAVDTIQGMAQAIAMGVADALLRFIRALYAYVVLRPLDFAGGFWWELTRRFLGYLKERAARPGAGASKWELPGAELDAEAQAGEERKSGQAFSDEDKKRIWFMLFCFSSYYLAFGRDGDGNYHLDKAVGGVGNLFNRDLWGKRNYNNRARLRANVQGVTVARRRSRVTSRKAGPVSRRTDDAAPSRDGKEGEVLGRGQQRINGRVVGPLGEEEVSKDANKVSTRRRDPATGRFRKRPDRPDGRAEKATEDARGQRKAKRTPEDDGQDKSR